MLLFLSFVSSVANGGMHSQHPRPIRKTCQSIKTDTLARVYTDNLVKITFS